MESNAIRYDAVFTVERISEMSFFQPSQWQNKNPLPMLPECGKCKLDKGCNSPYMKVSGQGKRRVLILGESPGEKEDDEGRQFVGNAGIKLVQILFRLGVNMRRDCWLFDSLACKPKGNAEPKKDQISFCRPNVVQVIEELSPDVIIPVGKAAVQSLMPLMWGKDDTVDSMGKWAGWRIPSQKLGTWVCPTHPPSFVCRNESSNLAAEREVFKHLKAAFEIKGKPWPNGIPDYKKQVRIVMDHETAAAKIEQWFYHGGPCAIDIETTTLKPDGPHAEILCCAISDGTVTLAYPWVGKAIEATKNWLLSDVPKVGAQIRFESRWFLKFLKVFPRNWIADTLLDAHLLNCAGGITSLKFQAFVLLGMDDYDSAVDGYKKAQKEGGNEPNRMKELEPHVMLEYCGMDSCLEWHVSNKQRRNYK